MILKARASRFATPRSWSFVSDMVYDEDIDTETLTNLVSGAVGDGLAVKFMAHRKIASKLPKADDILDGKVERFRDQRDLSDVFTDCFTLL